MQPGAQPLLGGVPRDSVVDRANNSTPVESDQQATAVECEAQNWLARSGLRGVPGLAAVTREDNAAFGCGGECTVRTGQRRDAAGVECWRRIPRRAAINGSQ